MAVTNLPEARDAQLSFSMLSWAYNEEENICAFLQQAEAFLNSITDNYEMILIEDGSTDRTLEIVRECQGSRPWLRVHVNDRNCGSGYNMKIAISLASKDYIFWQTIDWAYNITTLGENLHLLHKYDILQGFRGYPWMLQLRSDNRRKAIISLVNYYLIRILFRLPVKDYQNVTVYPRQLVHQIKLESQSAFTNPECLLKAWWMGATIHQVPVPFIKRSRGKAKGTRLKVVVASVLDIMRWWIVWVVMGKRSFVRKGQITNWVDDR